MSTACERCGKDVRVLETFSGQVASCPRCNAYVRCVIRVRGSAEPTPITATFANGLLSHADGEDGK